MAGILVLDDDFTGLATDTTISGRIPPLSDSGYAHAVDPGTTGAVGGGSGDVKFNGSGVAVKARSLLISGAIQIVMDDKGGNEEFRIFTRDTYTTPYPRNGYYATFRSRFYGGVSGNFSAGYFTNYVSTSIISGSAWTYASDGINTVALESIGNNHRIIINNVVAYSFTNSAFPEIANANKYSVTYGGSATPSIMRMNRLSVYDSIVISASATPYVIVTVA